MSASEHLNPDQMVKMYHISWDDTPPHELEPSRIQSENYAENLHPDVLHMGTRRAAVQIQRTHLHEYQMHPQDIDPVVYGDAAGQLLFVATRPEHPLVRDFNKRMEGKQQGLWEHISADPKEAVQTGKVIPYRNTHEDRGSISYMVPKSAIRSGKVKYAGVTDLTKDDLRKKIEQEERLYD